MTEVDRAEGVPEGAQPMPPAPTTRREAREAREARERATVSAKPKRLSVVGVLGELLITAGVVVMLFLGWYIWLDDIIAGNEQQVAAIEVQEQFQSEWERGDGVVKPPSVDPGEPIVSARVGEGQVFGALIVPRFGENYTRSIASGIDPATVLNSRRIGIGHYSETQMPGEFGNFAIAAHRNTYGGAFSEIDKLRLGDRIYVETVDGWYEYSFRGLEYVLPTRVDVLAAVPTFPELAPTERVLTMTSCNPRYSTAERIIAYAVLETWHPRAGGPPTEISGLIEARG